ncbi:Maf family protein [Aliivibrio fischeri]|uniref:dTTP/UTP pyrophosphatase n=1 Tax=Aliivibrio fischeri SR5 TaxID=1088719 RepID=A0AAV3EWE3_ALIFS|nr:Maf family protein [Aliivibrio fischeri]EHN71185.1 Maf-like protein [Aliivibrio fischeri SR5]MUJ19326.1 septum formation inhibitor Maf [Aliivibrio fischeri]MUJ24867.1 septum formation inhibitor Maf [Aliivibrio fischeri]MUK26307.1 septum formation inhibitor Maf [Aliivibrio fischeri]MUK32474.1 septum formation inhibitor Maf [Aliivibrio fischeri]
MEAQVFLASGSPRRKELLTQLGYQFDVLSVDVEEIHQEHETALMYVERLSKDKAQAGVKAIEKTKSKYTPVLGSDTIVVIDGVILEKPKDFEDAKRMLLALSGRQHQVMTAVTIATPEKIRTKTVITQVWFKTLSEQEIEQYWESGEPCDKAGSYGIQGSGGRFVSRIDGSYHAVMGLPLMETDQLLHQFL